VGTFVCFNAFGSKFESPQLDYAREINRLLPSPASIDPTSDLISRAEYQIISKWLSQDNNPAVKLASSMSQCKQDFLKSDSFRKDFNFLLEDEFKRFDLNSIFDEGIRQRMKESISAIVSEQLLNDCSFDGIATTSRDEYFELVNSYSQVVDAIAELQQVVNLSESHESIRRDAEKFAKSLDENSQAKMAASLKVVFEEIENVDIEKFDTEQLILISNTVIKSELGKQLPSEVKKIFEGFEQAKKIKTVFADINSTVNDTDVSINAKIDSIQLIANGYLGKSDRRNLAVSSLVAKFSTDSISEAEALTSVVAIFKKDMDQELITAIGTGNQIYKALEGTNFDFKNLNTDNMANIAPAVNSIAKIAFKISPGSDEAKALDAVTNIGIAYFTGNPAAVMGTISSLSGSSGPSPEQQRHQAIMAQLNIINKKLDKILDGQQKILDRLEDIGLHITKVEQKLDGLKKTMESAKIEILNGLGEIKTGIGQHGNLNSLRQVCAGKYDLLTNDLEMVSKIKIDNRHFKFQLRIGDSLGKALEKVPFSQKLISENTDRYKNWFRACYAYVNFILLEEEDGRLFKAFSASSYEYKDIGTSTNTQEFKDFFSKLASPIACANNNNAQHCKRKPSNDKSYKYLNLAERRAINILENSNDKRLLISNLSLERGFDFYVSKTDMAEINLIRWLTLKDHLLETLNPMMINEVSHIAFDLIGYLEIMTQKDSSLFANASIIKKFLPKLKKYLLLTVLQQEVLGGASYVEEIYERYELRRNTKKDIDMLKVSPELSRRLFIRQCRIIGTMTKNSCLNSLLSSAADNHPIELTHLMRFHEPIISVAAYGDNITLNIDDIKFTISAPSRLEIIQRSEPPATHAIHARATLVMLDNLLESI